MSTLQITPVSTQHQREQFVDFPYHLYAKSPQWIPPLRALEIKEFDPQHNPSLAHCKTAQWLAKKGENVIGRIQVILNLREWKHLGTKEARFNHWDLIDDPEVAEGLITAALEWAEQSGCTILKGPYGYTNLDQSGLLISGFERKSTFATLYNHSYYQAHLERLGFKKKVDWVERHLSLPKELPSKFKRIPSILKSRYDLKTLDLKTRKDMMAQAHHVMEVFLESYQQLEGYVPLSAGEVQKYIDQYLSFLRPDYIRLVADSEGKLVGFGLTTPDMGNAFQKSKGNLWPWAWWHLWRARQKNPVADLILIGVAPKWRNKGVPGLVFKEVYESFRKAGVKEIMVHPMLEHNQPVHALFDSLGAKPYRRRRAYQTKIIP